MTEEDKQQIFNQLKSMLSKYTAKLEIRGKSDTQYHLYGKKTVTAFNKEVDGIYFASASIQKNFVGFYFFPIYTHISEFDNTPEILRKCLKGKSCFHIKKHDDELYSQINNILDRGYKLYNKNGWF